MAKYIKIQETWPNKEGKQCYEDVIINTEHIISVVPGGWRITSSPAAMKDFNLGDDAERYKKEIGRINTSRINLSNGEHIDTDMSMEDLLKQLND